MPVALDRVSEYKPVDEWETRIVPSTMACRNTTAVMDILMENYNKVDCLNFAQF